ncbi:Transcriptional regulator STERILE APETALA [Striga hermonthica]|uniref:Transcriptional regulator STERILE APETALA n=1 Tax=Striga hermonthica TaxID=68872 RepID=A0A9N7R766_STRHE|nr:Transcriptional regulator STERILE APETALA [Striga hermonthica]
MSTLSSDEEAGGGHHEFEGPSSSRRRTITVVAAWQHPAGVWPAPFVEALAFRVAVDASRTSGRLAAAQALFNIFQVCSTWRAVSNSELLWYNLSRHIWISAGLGCRPTWRDEYIHRHRTAVNFHLCRHAHVALHLLPDVGPAGRQLSCRRLALSDLHLAIGFSDGGVHIFRLPDGPHLISMLYPHGHDRHLGRFSSSVSGIILTDARLVFATLDGDVHVSGLDGQSFLRRARMGDVVSDGALVDFSGSDRWWVGLYAGVPGRSFHIWNGETEELLFVGGSLTDTEALTGWHSLTIMTDPIGRVRVTAQGHAVACTAHRVIAFDLQNQVATVCGDEQSRRGIIVGSFDSNHDSLLVADGRGRAHVRRVGDLGEVSRFAVRRGSGRMGKVLGCMNSGCAVLSVGGLIRVWGIESGEYLYSFSERMEECSAIVVDETRVAACSSDGIVHVWNFGAQ